MNVNQRTFINPDRLIVRMVEPTIVHYSQYSSGTIIQHDETVCDSTRLHPGAWSFAQSRVVNCIFCIGLATDGIPP